MERVAIAFEREQTSQKIRRLLEGAGMARGICCRTAAEVKLLLGQQQIPTAICGYKLPDATAEELLFDLPEGRTLLLVAPENLLGLCREAPGLFRLSPPQSGGASGGGARRPAGVRPVPPPWPGEGDRPHPPGQGVAHGAAGRQ